MIFKKGVRTGGGGEPGVGCGGGLGGGGIGGGVPAHVHSLPLTQPGKENKCAGL